MEQALKKWDKQLLGLILLLTVWGLVVFFSVSSPLSQKEYGNSYHYLISFFFKNVLLGGIVFILFSFLSWKTLRRFSFLFFILSFLSIILTFIPFFHLPGQTANRWVYLGFFSFQPSEFLKFSLLLWLSFFIPKSRKEFKSPFQRGLTVLLAVGSISALVFLQPTLSNLLIIWVSVLAGYGALLSSVSFSQAFQEISPFILALILLIALSFLWGYRADRIQSFLSGSSTDGGIGFQAKQSQLAVGSGGLQGRGIGNSKVKLIGIPLMISDSLFSVYAEETGFLGSFFLGFLFIWLALRVSSRGLYAKDLGKRFFAYGTAFWITSQAFIHIGSNIGLIPSTGVPLPFFSFGSSSQVALMMALGVINALEYS